jgi:hypothetical protein
MSYIEGEKRKNFFFFFFNVLMCNYKINELYSQFQINLSYWDKYYLAGGILILMHFISTKYHFELKTHYLSKK